MKDIYKSLSSWDTRLQRDGDNKLMLIIWDIIDHKYSLRLKEWKVILHESKKK